MKIDKFIILSFVILTAPCSQAQLTLTGNSYNQDFNGLDAGLPDGWAVNLDATTTDPGTATTFITDHTSWGTTAGQFANYASILSDGATNFLGTESPSIQSDCSNRALGVRQTGTIGDPGAAIILNLSDTLGRTDFQMDLDMLMLDENPRSTTWTLDYAIGNTPTNFIPLATYDDPEVFGATHTNISFGSALDNLSDQVWIRIAALSDSTGSGSRDTFGIDNFSLSWSNLTALTQPVITDINFIGDNVEIDFTAADDDVASSFLLLSANDVTGDYNDTGATITQTGTGSFQAVCASNDSQQFFRIEYQPD